MRTAAVLTAAGSGSRLGHRLPKALVPLDGTPLVTHAARRLVASGGVDVLVVAAPGDHLDGIRAALGEALSGGPAGDDRVGVPVRVVAGGASRQASVAAALAALPDDVDVVLVHDAARALAPASLVRRVVDAVRAGHVAVVPVLPVTDTIVQVAQHLRVPVAARSPSEAVGAVPPGQGPDSATVTAALDRAALRAVQTPQGFDRAVLDRAHDAAADLAHDERLAATDDSSLVALLGVAVVAVAGDERALKITTARDLAVAGLVLAEGEGAR